ncbi:hypothetical protein [Herbiconiux daphne]|uniref:Uncharacterized protein n=1 Tax=Herbiconiux daphne TaxID=2970914 RepID=A0ABT2H2F6_9MICO|nr:hypothetical protein [Herbiconiux daphne]MCS5734089.1 hypothetical protein [Herbiconiux daphne]
MMPTPTPEHNRLTRQFLGSLLVAIAGCLGALASLVFLYPAHTIAVGVTLDVTLVVSLVVIVAAAVVCVRLASRISALNRGSRGRR